MTDIMTIQNVRGYLDEHGTAWLNVEDVARGLGFTQNKNGVEYVRWETVKGYLREFGFSQLVGKDNVIPTSGDDVKAGDYIPENMFYRLAMKAKNAAAESFQAKVADDILPSIRKTGSYSVQAATPVADMISDVRAVAENIQSLFGGVKRGIAISQAIDLVGSFKNFSLDSLKQLLPPAQHATGHLNATNIAKRLGLSSARAANNLLEKAGLQVKEGKDWRLTDAGRAYGEELPYTRNGHSDYRILWNETLISFLQKVLASAVKKKDFQRFNSALRAEGLT